MNKERVMNKEIARELVSMARELVAGGGAGIEFKVTDMELDDGLAVLDSSKEIYQIPDFSAKITEFDAEGYDDGERSVNGNAIFKPCTIEAQNKRYIGGLIYKFIFDSVSEDFNIYEENFEDFKSYYEAVERLMPEKIDCGPDLAYPSKMVMAGWTRGELDGLYFEDLGDYVWVETNDGHSDTFEADFNLDADFSSGGKRWFRETFLS